MGGWFAHRKFTRPNIFASDDQQKNLPGRPAPIGFRGGRRISLPWGEKGQRLPRAN